MNIVIIGAQKAGTSWLYSMLVQQPSIATAFQKEVHYFDNLYNASFSFARFRNRMMQMHGDRMRMNPDFGKYMQDCLDPDHAFTDAWYRRLFTEKPENRAKLDKGEKLVFLEGSPNYMALPEAGVDHMRRLLGDIEPVLLVRDPMRRMVSGISMELAKSPARFAGDGEIREFAARVQVPKGAYSKAIPLFRKFFSRLNIIPFMAIQRDPLGILRSIEVRYGLEQLDYARMEKKFGTKTGRVELSADVLGYIRSLCEPEYDYLRTEFGEDFLKEI
jgi:hypothetical protein